jgi:hypothetical protein
LINILREPETLEDAYYYSNMNKGSNGEKQFQKSKSNEREKAVYEKICKLELPNSCTCIKNKGYPK